MIDTISVLYQIDKREIKKNKFNEKIIINRQKNITYRTLYNNGSFAYTFIPECSNNPDCIKLDGSLSKAIYLENFKNHSFTEKTEKMLIEITEDELQLKLKDFAQLRRIDLGINIELNTNQLIKHLINVAGPRMSKHIWDSTIRWQNTNRLLRIYDKIKEVKHRGQLTDVMKSFLLEHKNITRIEVALYKSKNLKKLGIYTFKDILNFTKQKEIFFKELNRILKLDILMKKDNNKNLTAEDYILLEALKNILNEYGDLEEYRKILMSNGISKQSASKTIIKLKKLQVKSKKDSLINLNKEIQKEIDRIEKE
jgi:hypothetical protein